MEEKIMTAKDNLIIFGENVRYIRRIKKLTKEQLAEMMKLSIEEIELIEKGEPTDDTNIDSVFLLCKYLKIPISKIFEPFI